MALGVSQPASDDDWATEYLDLVLSIRVASMDEALEHISRYSSRHTEVICTTNGETAERFWPGSIALCIKPLIALQTVSAMASARRWASVPKRCRPGDRWARGWSPTAIACAVKAISPLITPVARASSRTKTSRCERSHRCSGSAAWAHVACWSTNACWASGLPWILLAHDLQPAGRSDALADTLDYAEAVALIRESRVVASNAGAFLRAHSRAAATALWSNPGLELRKLAAPIWI